MLEAEATGQSEINRSTVTAIPPNAQQVRLHSTRTYITSKGVLLLTTAVALIGAPNLS